MCEQTEGGKKENNVSAQMSVPSVETEDTYMLFFLNERA